MSVTGARCLRSRAILRMVAGAGRGIASSSKADTATEPLMQRNAASAAWLLRTASDDGRRCRRVGCWCPDHVEVVFDDDAAVFRDEAFGQLGSNEASVLFLGGRALQQNASVIDNEPIVLR